ncbi:DMT family transporter [Neotabrizicola shimadae]|uniref:DMT family transporter n=1 Tax=Neotabrizicola shimadae TaxID=2807096 RepID=A0A8G0ZUP0_9RHOB|nr:DMT family transporter [Neotabrizicola shimadae]QYZ70804.1 DMT family transporter [Neotabrizicola shimadae]
MTAAPAMPAARPLRGVALVVLAVLAFALADVLTKLQAERHPVTVVIAVRYLVNLALLVVLLAPRQGRALWRTDRTLLVMLRALCLAFASLTMGIALTLMPVAETVAIIYLSPFLVMLLAIPLLGERVPLAGWLGAAAGFAGVLLIVRPGGGLAPWGVVMALVNTLFATAYHLMTRQLSRTETVQAMLFHVALVGTVVFCVLALPDLPGLVLPPGDLAMMAALGALATTGHFLFTSAYREAPASLLAPVNYLHLVWAAGLGWLVFGHVPDAVTLVGIVLVAGAGVAVAIRTARAS